MHEAFSLAVTSLKDKHPSVHEAAAESMAALAGLLAQAGHTAACLTTIHSLQSDVVVRLVASNPISHAILYMIVMTFIHLTHC